MFRPFCYQFYCFQFFWHDFLIPVIIKLNAMKKLYTLGVILLLTQATFAGELFIRVMRQGYFNATVSNQAQSNNVGIFRFFELPGGSTWIRITDQNGNLVFNTSYYVGNNQRVIAEVNSYGNLNIIETQVINTTWYNSSYPQQPVYGNPYPNYGNPGFPNNGGYGNGTDQAAFQQFLSMLDQESFDSNKLTTAKGYADKTQLSAQQIADIAKKFTFDSNRLEWAKHAYARCYDKANYFLLKPTFSFSSSYNDLQTYINGQ